MRACAPGGSFVASVACTPIYDAQYNDSKSELEQFRTQFQPGTAQVQFITSSDHKVFWVNVDAQTSNRRMHSFDPAGGKQIDYLFDVQSQQISTDFRFSDDLIANCAFGEVQVWDATTAGSAMPLVEIGSNASETCAAHGGDMYFFVGQQLSHWTASMGSAATLTTDLSSAFDDSAAVDGLGVTPAGDKLVVSENGNLWVMTTGGGSPTFLHNPKVTNGNVAFDDSVVVYPTGGSAVSYQPLTGGSASDLVAAIKDGGYDLNTDHSDVQDIDGGLDEYAILGGHLIYRSQHGIFAYRFDGRKVWTSWLDCRALAVDDCGHLTHRKRYCSRLRKLL